MDSLSIGSSSGAIRRYWIKSRNKASPTGRLALRSGGGMQRPVQSFPGSVEPLLGPSGSKGRGNNSNSVVIQLED
jgi:hypothetical protein